jgi:hypothetical protein
MVRGINESEVQVPPPFRTSLSDTVRGVPTLDQEDVEMAMGEHRRWQLHGNSLQGLALRLIDCTALGSSGRGGHRWKRPLSKKEAKCEVGQG